MSSYCAVPAIPFTIRRAAIGDEEWLRMLRLDALSDAPAAFGSSYERELARTTADWQRWFSPGATFFLDTAAGPHGLVAGVPDANNAAVVHLMAMWVHPELRGSGGADALIAAVIAWAAERNATSVMLNIAKGNDRAQRCYERNGFRLTGRELTGGRPGLVEVEMVRAVDSGVSRL